MSDLKTIEGGVVTGTMDLDAEWVHENGPGAMICSGLTAMCKAHPWGVRDCRRRLRRPGEDWLQRHRSGPRSEPHACCPDC